jgi:uncharacterized repeat protein (TIGR01451 family)
VGNQNASLRQLGTSLFRRLRRAALAPLLAMLSLPVIVSSAHVANAAAPNCTLPGVTVLTDASGDQNAIGGPKFDIQSISVAEPFQADNVDRLFFTLKVANLAAPLPTNGTWTVHFTPLPGTTIYFVDMETDVTGAVTFSYGHVTTVQGQTVDQADGAADPASNFQPDGSITLVAQNSLVGAPAAGTILRPINANTAQLIGAFGTGVNVFVDSAPQTPPGTASYTLVGNSSCQTNLPPTAVLTAAPNAGPLPLTVSFDGSGSSDPNGNPITSYTFTFGDGSPPLTQSGATTSHTYTTAGQFQASLTVQDSAGLVSTNPASVAIDAGTPPAPISFGRPTISGIQGNGFEQDLRLDPTNPNRVYTSVPDGVGTGTSFVWRSNDAGKTFKWVPAAAPTDGTIPVCEQGGDTELAVDSAGHLYFNDLSLANFATSRSDNGGAQFTGTCAGVPDTVVDRQWYTVEGDPTLNNGTQLDNNILFLTADISILNPDCPTNIGNEVVLWRSPVPKAAGGATPDPSAGLTFGPHLLISCDEGIMGNDEISPVATKMDSSGNANGLATALRHVYVVHDSANLDKIYVARCYPVPFTTDRSGSACVDKTVASLSGTTGANFPTMAIDAAGNIYAVWEETASGGRTILKYSYSTDQAQTWATPIALPLNAPPNLQGGQQLGGPLNTNVMAWPAAGDDGRLDIAWYGTNATGASPDVADGFYGLYLTQSLNAHDPVPTFTAPILASEHTIHKGTQNTLIGGQNGDRSLGDFLQLRIGTQGEAEISYADSSHKDQGDLMSHAMFVRQVTGPSLRSSVNSVNISGLTPTNSVTDPTGDGTFDANGMVSANIPNLDITGSSVTKPAASSCAGGIACYRVVMNANSLSSLSPPTTSGDTDPVVEWLTTWMEPSSSDTHGGKFFHVYAESNNGAAPVCFSGESSEAIVQGAGQSVNFLMTYPGQSQITTAGACSVNQGTSTVTIDVPVSNVTVAGEVGSTFYSVTGATLTLAQPGSTTNPSEVPPNLIDEAPAYDFTPGIDLSIAATDAPDPVYTGDDLLYTLSAADASAAAATGVTVTDTLPSGVVFESATPSQGSCTQSSGTVSCNLGSLAGGGGTATVAILVAPTAGGGTYTSTASVSADQAELTPGNNTASISTTVTGAACTIIGTPGDDAALTGTAGNDRICGIGGNDTIHAGDGNDVIVGGAGNDSIFGENGADVAIPGLGNDSFDGGAGSNTVSYTDIYSRYGVGGVNVALPTSVTGGAGSDTLDGGTVENAAGSPQDDTLTGDGFNNSLYGLDGNDTMSGGAGNDYMEGNAGNDSLSGGDGNDRMAPGTGDDSIDGGVGTRDAVTYYDITGVGVTVDLGITTAQNTIGAGTDTITTTEDAAGTLQDDTLTGDGGPNTLVGRAGNDIMSGGAGNDYLEGDSGNDTQHGDDGIDALLPGLGNDPVVDCGAGVDAVSYGDIGTAGVTVDLNTTTAQNTGAGGTDTISNCEGAVGSNGNDTLTGTPGNNNFIGLLGNDTISGGGGTDVIEADAGNDTITGGDGNDSLLPGTGDDSVDGGAGTDAVSYPEISAALTVDLGNTGPQNTGGAGTDTITTVENAAGGSGADTLTGTATNNTLVGRGGDDSLIGLAGNDYLEGDAGNDTADGGDGFDTCVSSETRIACEAGTVFRPASASALSAEDQFRAMVRQWNRMGRFAHRLTMTPARIT